MNSNVQFSVAPKSRSRIELQTLVGPDELVNWPDSAVVTLISVGKLRYVLITGNEKTPRLDTFQLVIRVYCQMFRYWLTHWLASLMGFKNFLRMLSSIVPPGSI